MTLTHSTRIWFDAWITPNCAMSQRGLAVVSLALVLPALLFGAFLLMFRAWPATLFLGGEAILATIALHWRAVRLREQGERIVLTDDALTVEAWDRGRVAWRMRLEPTWARVSKTMLADSGCEAVFVHSHRRSIRIAHALSPGERATLAEALETALFQRKSQLASNVPQLSLKQLNLQDQS